MTQWVLIPDSTVTFMSEGGPLLISIDVSLYAAVAQTFSCRPLVDGEWAGHNGGHPFVSLWTEGLQGTTWGWVNWTKSRVYKGIPAGGHTLSVECLKDSAVEMLAGHSLVPQSVSVLELH
jgi:hypothetical protein